MNRAARSGAAALAVALALACVAMPLRSGASTATQVDVRATAAQPDARAARELKFDVFLGERPIGYQRFTLQPSSDGLRIETRAEFAVRVLGVKVYEYDHRNTEVWRGDCLQTIESQTNSNGKAYRVQGRAVSGAFVVDARAGERRLSDCVGTFAYWDKRQLLSRTQLLNPQTGEYVPVRVRALGPATLELGARRVAVDRYALLGKDLDITLEYASGTGEWLSLESRIEGDRLLRYRRAEPAKADPARGG